MIDRDVEKSLNLSGVKVHREDTIDASCRQEIRDEFGGDGNTRLVFPILPCIAKEGNHCRDAIGTGPFCCIHHDEQLHQIFVGRRARRLDDEDVTTTDVFVNFHEGFPIRKLRHGGVGFSHSEVAHNVFCKLRVSGSAENSDVDGHGESILAKSSQNASEMLGN